MREKFLCAINVADLQNLFRHDLTIFSNICHQTSYSNTIHIFTQPTSISVNGCYSISIEYQAEGFPYTVLRYIELALSKGKSKADIYDLIALVKVDHMSIDIALILCASVKNIGNIFFNQMFAADKPLL